MSQIERAGGDDRIAFGAFVLDCADERLWGPGGPIRLGRKAFLVLQALLSTPGRLVTKEELFSSVWDGTIVSESVLTTVIKELRRALSDDRHDGRWIETVYGRGYRFKGEILATAAEPAAASHPIRTGTDWRPVMVLVSTFDDTAVYGRYPWLATGLREEILSALARFREIRLIAESDGEDRYRIESGYQLIAALLPDSEGVKVLARVKRLPENEIVWAEAIGLAGEGLAGGVETIVRRIVGAALPAVDRDVFLGLPPGDDGFYARYVRARTRSYEARDYGDARVAATALKNLIDERPSFGLAYPPLARLLNTDHAYTGLGTTGPPERALAFELAKAGLAADPLNAHSHLLIGFCHLWHDERDLALECLDEALRLNPYNPARLREVATGIMWIGDLDRAQHLLAESVDLQPLHDDRYYEDLAELALLRGDHATARAHLRRVRGDRLWATLYDGLTDPDPGRLAAWRAMVSERWLGDPLTDQKLADWIGFHRAFAPEHKMGIMALVQDRLAATSASSSSAAKAEMKHVIGGGGGG